MKRENEEGMHAVIMAKVRETITSLQAVSSISPTLVAIKVHDYFINSGDIEAHLEWCSIEHLKQLAREALRHFNPTDRARVEALAQNDMFSEHLQDRYPIQVPKDEEPQYVRRDDMTPDQLDWSIAQIRRAGRALLKHGDALSAYRDMRFGSDDTPEEHPE
jgi:hypothetical protein